MKFNRFRPVAGAKLIAAAAVVGLAVELDADDDHFPLVEGARWSYVATKPFEQRFELVLDRFDGEAGTLFFQGPTENGEEPVWRQEVPIVELAEDEIDVIVEGTQAPYYRFKEDVWRHGDVDLCMNNTSAEVIDRNVTVETPAGIFDECLQLRFSGAACADAGTIAEYWCRDVGLVRRDTVTIAGVSVYLLESFDFEPGETRFRRGDFDADGQIVISDAIAVLNWLFASAEKPECERATDMNADGSVNVADPIYLLQFLFGDGAPPPPPYEDCGTDSSPAEVGCVAFAGC